MLLAEPGGAERRSLPDSGDRKAQGFRLNLRFLLTHARQSFHAVVTLLQRFEIGEEQFSLDDLDVALRIDAPFDMDDVVVNEAANDVQDRIRALGIEPAAAMISEEAIKWIAIEQDKWAKVIREKGIRAE